MNMEMDTASQSRAKKGASSVHEPTRRKAPFGSRFLTDEGDVWNHNAWDHVSPPEDQGGVITKALENQKTNSVPLEERAKYNDKPSRHWDNFYKMNAANFFRDRKWLHNEFPELIAGTKARAGPFVVAEIGCGAGNSAFPLLTMNENPELSIYAYDYSPHAVKLVQRNLLYEAPPIGTIQAAVWDLTTAGIPSNLQEGIVDVVVLVFVMSALHPDEWTQAVGNIYKMLRPGGLVVLRDYGRYDLAQLRFKRNRLLDDNFYIRGDKTRVYFFELDELSLLFTGRKATDSQHASADPCVVENGDDAEETCLPTINPSLEAYPISEAMIHPNLLSPEISSPRPLFSAEQLGIDRRLLVNRKRQLKMYRVWMQGQFRKPLSGASGGEGRPHVWDIDEG